MTANIFQARRIFPYIVSLILSGIDEEDTKLYFLDSTGGHLEEDKFASAGTDFSIAYGVLEQNYEDGMDEDSALKLAAQTIQQAIERDVATGDGVMVAKIDEEGYQETPQEEVERLLK